MAEFTYLNDPILVGVQTNGSTVIQPNTPCTYKVMIRDVSGRIDSSAYQLIYVGSLYYTKPCYITLNDIVQSYVNDFYWFDYNDYPDRPNKDDMSFMFLDLYVEVSDNAGHKLDYWIDNIFNGYRTPNLGDIKLFDPNGNVPISPSYRNGYNVRPRVPSLKDYSSSDFKFPCYVFINKSVLSLKLGLYNEGLPETEIESLSPMKCPLHNTTITYNHLHNVTGPNRSFGISTGDKYVLLCDVDDNPADYYLMWINRHGASQCQPFCKKDTLKETVKTNYMTRLNNNTTATYNHRMQLNPQVPYSKSVEYTWTLNSHWLTYDEYNEFESLLTSKYVYLFDYKHNTVYDVVVSNANWEYKNPKNTKKPFNLTIDVKKASTDNIIY